MTREYRVEPIMTAPKDQGREILVVVRDGRARITVSVYWWRHWSMKEGVWWCMGCGVVEPVAWINE